MIPMSLILGMAAMTVHTSTSSNAVVLYVSPDGDDRWSGKLESSNAARTDGPFASIERARDAIRELRSGQEGLSRSPVKVVLRDGTYFLDETLVFTPEDSGTEASPVSFVAYEGETPILSGGQQITDWKQTVLNGKEVWVSEIPQVRAGEWFFRELWVNGERRQRARHPNTGYLKVAEVPDSTADTPWHEGQTRFCFEEGDLKAWQDIDGAELTVMTRWTESHLPILSIDESECTVNLGKRSVFQISPGDLYYVENVPALLDTPGEWCLSRNDGLLYYLPMPGETMNETEVIAPRLLQLVRLEGKPESGQFVEYLAFQDIHFAHSEWWFQGFTSQWPKPDVGGFAQAAIGVPGAVHGEGVRRCSFERCTIAHVGTYGLELGRGCQHNRVIECSVFDLGAGGIKIGETTIRDNEAEQTYDNEIRECAIHDGGILFHSAIGIWVGQSFDNRFIRNHIHDFYYSGFSIGWTWGYGKSLARGNVVDGNHVHHIGIKSNGDGPILSDMGGIYTLGIQPGTVIRNNHFHDIAGLRYGGWGIYFDEGSTHILAENNLVYRTTHGSFHQHYGKENVVRNNILALARDHQIQRSRAEEHSSFTFEQNIVYWREGELLAGNLSNLHFAFDRNLYWHVGGGEIRFGDIRWDEWQAKGMDRNSLIADPLFVDPGQDDFRLKGDSPAFKLGFTPFEVDESESQ